ncbi:MAG: glycosyl hydrolase family 65 protein, partial [Thioalkalivibrio sp.]
QREVNHLRIAPCIPDHWSAYTLHYRYRETFYHIQVSGAAGGSRRVIRVSLDGTEIRDEVALEAGWGRIPLVDDRQTHHVEVGLG